MHVDTDTGPRQITSKIATLLRLGTLGTNHTVHRDVMRHALTIENSSVNKYVADLRNQLGVGTDRLHTRGEFILFEGDWDDSDARDYEMALDRATAIADGRDFRELGRDEARSIREVLEPTINAWSATPATGFAEAAKKPVGNVANMSDLQTHLRDLETIADIWIDRELSAQTLLAYAQLASGDKRHIHKAYTQLMSMAQSRDPDPDIWLPLVAAGKGLDSGRHRRAWSRCEEWHRRSSESIPEELLEFQPLARGRRRPPEDPGELLQLMELIGVVEAAESLTGSRLEPRDCIAQATSRLYFSGVLANKWVADPKVLSEFRNLLQRLDASPEPTEVKFLVIDPDSPAFQELSQLRANEPKRDSVDVLIDLADEFQCLEVRGMTHLPAFRMIEIDEDLVTFSPYALDKEGDGWESPHVMLDSTAQFPLAAAFHRLFMSEWRAATVFQGASE